MFNRIVIFIILFIITIFIVNNNKNIPSCKNSNYKIAKIIYENNYLNNNIL